MKTQEPENLIDKKELAEKLGICKRTIETFKPPIPCLRVGRQVKYEYSEVLKHLKNLPENRKEEG